jgi:hypothetical protein
VLLVGGLGGAMLYFESPLNDAEEVLNYVSYLGSLVFPAALIRLFNPSTRFFLAFYIGLHVFLAAVTLLVAMISGISNELMTAWICPIPNCAFLLRIITTQEAAQCLSFTGLVTVASLGILIARSMTPLRESRRQRSEKTIS